MWTGPRKFAVAAAAGLLLLLVGGKLAAGFVVDLFWYRSLGFEEVFWTRWNAALLVRGTVGLVAGGVVFLNLWIIARTLGAIRVRRRYANIEIAERLPYGYLLAAALAIAALSAWWLSAGMGDPVATLAHLRAPAWGLDDPVFGKDLSFYVFRYPLLTRVQALLAVLLFWTLLVVGGCYFWTGGIRWSKSEFELSVTARRHLGLLAAALFLVFAWDLWLERYGLLIGGGGIGGALGYTDDVARIPGKAIVAVLAVLAAGSVAYGAWRGTLREPLLGVGTLIAGALAAQLAVPAVVQRFRVEPDELAREAPYIRHHIQFTRYAFGLSDLESRPLPYSPAAVPEAPVLNQALASIPLWDTRPLLQSYRELEARRRYYNFASAYHDRYDGEQVVISVRELDTEDLTGVGRTWQNLHINYVRGEGAVVSPAARPGDGNEPPYYLSDICPIRVAPDTPAELDLTDPGVYFGQRTRGYALIIPGRTESAQSECPVGAVPEGVPLGSWWTKLAFAWAFQSKNLLLSDAVTPQTSVIYRRGVRQRAAELAPFLLFPSAEESAYPVIHDGRVTWILDAYTASTRFPLAPNMPIGDYAVRYIRNSVKVTVDGVTGDVRFYMMDERDPVLRAYRRIFPGLFRPIARMPPGLREHLRFPAPLLSLQAAVLTDYHLQDPAAFYSREDVWAIPTETYRDQPQPFAPVYAMLPLPGSDEPEFLLSIPFVAAGRQNMTALLVARNDPPRYGEQILFELPRDQGVPGPQQVETLIDQDPEISEQLSLWERGGSDVIRGQLLIVPVDSTLVFAEPLYLEAEASAIPQLERVILVAGNQVVMRPGLEGAIRALTNAEAGGEPSAETAGAGETADDTAPADLPNDGALVRARQLLERAEVQLRAGDWAGFGETWNALRGVLETGPEDRGETP